jgi:hypothetical protein
MGYNEFEDGELTPEFNNGLATLYRIHILIKNHHIIDGDLDTPFLVLKKSLSHIYYEMKPFIKKEEREIYDKKLDEVHARNYNDFFSDLLIYGVEKGLLFPKGGDLSKVLRG